MNNFLIAGSNNQVIADVLPATRMEKKKLIIIFYLEIFLSNHDRVFCIFLTFPLKVFAN